jgi:hypothetical protein
MPPPIFFVLVGLALPSLDPESKQARGSRRKFGAGPML